MSFLLNEKIEIFWFLDHKKIISKVLLACWCLPLGAGLPCHCFSSETEKLKLSELTCREGIVEVAKMWRELEKLGVIYEVKLAVRKGQIGRAVDATTIGIGGHWLLSQECW